MDHAIDMDMEFRLKVAELGKTKMLQAISRDVPNLIVTGTDDSDLWDCLGPVIMSLFQSDGRSVQSLTLDRSEGARDIRVHIKVSDGRADQGHDVIV